MIDKVRCILSLIIVAFVVGGCYPAPPTTNQAATSNISASPTLERLLATLVLTATQVPGITPPPTPEYPKLITPRVTPFPTISHAEANEDVARMLQTNGNCTFPCFWGIYPDQTRYEEIYSITDHLGSSRFETLSENGHIRISSDFGLGDDIGVQVEFQADLQNDIVQNLKVLLLNLWKTEVTPEDWSVYNMDEILRTYGVPDKVELFFSGPGNALSFLVHLKYERIDTSIAYSVKTTETARYETPSSVIFCPEEVGANHVELHMGKHPFNMIPEGVPILKATGLTEQDFYELFTEDPSACLTLNRKAFYP